MFLDGGTGSNNPVYELWILAQDVFCPTNSKDSNYWSLEDNIGCIVSLGTGVPTPRAFGVYPTAIGKALLAIATETENTARRFARDKALLSDGGRYFRFNVPSGLDRIAMEDSKSKSAIVAVTDRYLEDQDTVKKMEKCANILKGSKRMSSLFLTLIALLGAIKPNFGDALRHSSDC
jgi:hypothetical protein